MGGRLRLQTVPTETKVTVGNTSTLLLAANTNRNYCTVTNDSDEVIYMKVGQAAVMNEGIRLNASGGTKTWSMEDSHSYAVYGICTSGGKNAVTSEGY